MTDEYMPPRRGKVKWLVTTTQEPVPGGQRAVVTIRLSPITDHG